MDEWRAEKREQWKEIIDRKEAEASAHRATVKAQAAAAFVWDDTDLSEEARDTIRQAALSVTGDAEKAERWVKGSRRNNFPFRPPMHPAWLRCETSEYVHIPASSRLARRAPRHPNLGTYSCATPNTTTVLS